MLITLNSWAGAYASVACMAFAVVYSTITPWWRTTTGRLIMMLMGGLAGLASLSVLFSAYRDLDVVRTVRLVFVMIVGTAIWGHVVALVAVQYKGRKSGTTKGKHRS